jgi:hypothetical protein
MLNAGRRSFRLTSNKEEISMSKKIEETPVNSANAKQSKILSRRAVLRGVLMMSASLLVPISLFSAPSSAATATPAAAKKLAKAGVKYQDKPKGDQKCGTCTNFIAASKTCKLVEGPISPDGYCILWAKKA